MNDIKWRTQLDDDFWELLNIFNNHDILIKTDITIRLSNTKYFDEPSGKMLDCNERLREYAFYEK